MIDIGQIEKLIELLPKIVLYIAPGYITIAMYKVSKDSVIKDNKMTLIKSIFISYIYVAIINLLPLQLIPFNKISFINQEDISDIINNIRVLLVAFIAFFVGAFSGPILRCEWVNNIILKIHRTTITSDLIGDIKKLAKDDKGIYLMVYLENEGIAYDGYLILDKMNDETQRYLILDCYRKYIIHKQEPGYKLNVKYDHSKSHNDFTVIHYDRITQIEFSIDDLKALDDKVNAQQSSSR